MNLETTVLSILGTGSLPHRGEDWRAIYVYGVADIHHNFLIDNYSPQENVDNDDGSAYYYTHDNFLVYGGQGMKNDFGGHDNHHYNNIYAYAGRAMGVTNTLSGHEDYFYGNKCVLTKTDVGGVQCKDPKTQLHDNQYFTSTGDITICGKSLSDSDMDPHSTVSKTPGDDTILGWAKDLLTIKTTDEAFV